MFLLSIPKPCHENWLEMTPDIKGRFCGSCQKIVVDFTGMSDDEVKNYLLDRQHQDTCGRFLASQVGRPLENQPVTINRHWYVQLPYTRQVFYAFALFFVLGVSSCNWETTRAQQQTQQDTLIASSTPDKPALPDSTCIAGTVQAPRSPAIHFRERILTGDVQITGVPFSGPEPDTVKQITGKIAITPPDTVQSNPMIMGGISMPPIPTDSSK